jgi:2',3'-cyclic-nucleotide 2'-phosphodiesterase (5'-nucleotidase family)
VSTCQKAHDLVKEHWFQSVLENETSDVDLVVVVGHTPVRNVTGDEFAIVLSAIRKHLPSIPVQFFGGHTHIRDFRKFDDLSYGIESGRYLETIGWVNLHLKPFSVGRSYIDNNLDGYKFHLGMESQAEFDTETGKGISDEIQRMVSRF